MIEGHGDDLFRYGGKVKINFSSNIPQGVNHDGLVGHLYGCGGVISNYPEPEPRSVERHLGAVYGMSPERFVVTNGATEAIYLLAHRFEGGKSAVVVPTFREYQDAARVFSHRVTFVGTIAEACSCEADVVWLCNPNNPTGCVFDRAGLLAAVDGCKGKFFIIDQAYALYSVKPVVSLEDMERRGNVILINSLTKQFVVPGLRIGYAVGPAALMETLRGLRMPWSVNSLAIEAAHYLLDNREKYVIDSRAMHAEAERLADALRGLGMRVGPTDCNFLLACLPSGRACDLKRWLVESHGILVRDASNFEGLGAGHFRIAAQSPEENGLLIKALKEWMSL